MFKKKVKNTGGYYLLISILFLGKKWNCCSTEFSSLRFPNEISEQRQDQAPASGSQANISVPPPDPRPFLNRPSDRRVSSGPKVALASLAWARPRGRPLRARRHAHSRGSRGHHQNQLMRVGCVLGTCQVQNLSHRLYQLIGQSGREDSSPMNPQSPHSYGWIRGPLTTPTVCLSIIYLSIYVLLVVVAFSVFICEWALFGDLCTHLIYLWLIHLHKPEYPKH